MEDCQICYLKFTKNSKRKRILCANCGLRFCLQCLRESSKFSGNEIKCPQCACVFDKAFLETSTSRSFMESVYRYKRENFLFDEQMKYTGVSAQFVDSMKRKRALGQEINDCYRIIDAERDRIRDIHAKLELENSFFYGKLTDDRNKEKTERRVCIDADCNGLLRPLESTAAAFGDNDSDSLLVCTSCDKNVCATCMQCVSSGEFAGKHQCAAEDVESLKLIERECKNCPNCAVKIAFVDGCSQMFCTQCYAAFDWKTLTLIRSGSYFHNPHFFVFREQNGGNTESSDTFYQDMTTSSDDEIDFTDFGKRIGKSGGDAQTERIRYMKGFLFYANELLDKFGKNKEQMIEHRQRLNRVLFILNELNEGEFKTRLYYSERSRQTTDDVEEKAREYAHFTRDALTKWIRNSSVSEEETVRSINDKFSVLKSFVLNSSFSKMTARVFLHNNHVKPL